MHLRRIALAAASGNGDSAMTVDGNSAVIQSSTASGNGFQGIFVDGNAAVVKGNLADANGFGSGSDLAGLGVWVNSTTTPPVGTNAAHGNDEPTDCLPTTLC